MAENEGDGIIRADDGNVSNDIGGFAVTDPGDIGGAGSSATSTGGATPGRRGRRKSTISSGAGEPGDKAPKQSAKTTASINVTQSLLFSLHTMGASILAQPEISLSEDEAKTLATAIVQVQALYPSNANAKAVAWGNLALVAGVLYAPRVIAVMRKNRPAPRAAAQAPRVVPGPGMVFPPAGAMPFDAAE